MRNGVRKRLTPAGDRPVAAAAKGMPALMTECWPTMPPPACHPLISTTTKVHMNQNYSPSTDSMESFLPGIAERAIYVPPKIENFCWRIEHAQIREGGFAMIHGEPGSGKSIVLRLLAEA